ncbi:nicotinate-nucleotide adenylyltransferase [Phaeovibrio sulfidiphilus]|uniref:Probable nicotinate-nucleotide adenylyltransferase n=1 Tax=Phaeovibrio sulfidiphilus TaxID=1220600 RepID=A0A8J6YNT8_9PROT|nr:nicotinate-nucleotide adenylyltransferase [Phaeovibrio sulfidiphilus]
MARAVPSAWGDSRRARIGILGGSFNPAHEGHLHISQVAIERLNLDFVWWLVSPGNPLKSRAGMAPQAVRYRAACKVVRGCPQMVPLCLETDWGTVRTADTLKVLRTRFPNARFVWIMGADNLVQLPRWERWEQIVGTMPIAVVDRSPYSHRALSGRMAVRYRAERVPMRKAGTLAGMAPPAWVFLSVRTHSASATALRATLGQGWVQELGHDAQTSLPACAADRMDAS